MQEDATGEVALNVSPVYLKIVCINAQRSVSCS